MIRIRTPEPEWVQIVGVVAHQRQTSIAEAGREQIYFADGFLDHGAAGRWILRTDGDPGKFAAPVRAEVAKLGAGMLITEMQTADVWVEHAQAGTHFQLLLVGAFAAIAALLAGVGLYGVLSTVVRQWTAEIGVRIALGAGPGSIFNLVVGHGLRLSAAGIVLGIVAAFGLTRAMTTMVVGIKPTDPATYAGIVVLFVAIAIVACWIPGLRAAGLDPTTALREE